MEPEQQPLGLDPELEKSLLDYKGNLTSEVRVQLLDLLHCIAQCNLGDRKDLKKLVGIALELLDNAQRYNTGMEVEFRWRIEGSVLMVTIRNRASKINAERLMEAVDSIERMTPEQIALAFRKQLTNEQFGAAGGAGLGMLQIAKKVGKKITADVQPVRMDEFICTSQVSADLGPNLKRA